MSEKIDISVVVPVYNEEKYVSRALYRITKYLNNKDFNYEIIISDDGSFDQTISKINPFLGQRVKLISNKANKGKGHAIRRGVSEARGNWILFTDVDLSTPIEELDNFFSLPEMPDVVIGSRALPDSNITVSQPTWRQLGGRALNLFVLLILPGIKDSQCGFKLFRHQVAKEVFGKQKIDKFGFDIEILYIARKHGFTTKEFPITWSNRSDSRVRPFRDGLQILLDIFTIKVNDLRGIYGNNSDQKFLLVRFLLAGGIGALVNLGFLYLLTEFLGVWYLLSAVASFSLAVLTSFLLQKFWTFRDKSIDKMSGQLKFFVSIAVFNLGLNTLLMYLFVDGIGLHYLLAQIFAGGLVAVWSFFAYSRLVFKSRGRIEGS